MKNKRLARPLTIKAVGDDGIFEGYGSVFEVKDFYGDVVEPGAFAKSLAAWNAKGGFPALLWGHDHNKPIGVYESMAEDEHGLFVRGRLLKDEVAAAGEAYALLKAGAVSGLSIGYRPVVEEYDSKSKINRLKEIDLWETSLVVFPANEAATVTSIKTVRDFEGFLRESGYSRKEACRIASRGFEGRNGDHPPDIAEVEKLIVKNILTMKGV
jgi:HK97 family phage prohead protease